jgi:hypothetical protein
MSTTGARVYVSITRPIELSIRVYVSTTRPIGLGIRVCISIIGSTMLSSRVEHIVLTASSLYYSCL